MSKSILKYLLEQDSGKECLQKLYNDTTPEQRNHYYDLAKSHYNNLPTEQRREMIDTAKSVKDSFYTPSVSDKPWIDVKKPVKDIKFVIKNPEIAKDIATKSIDTGTTLWKDMNTEERLTVAKTIAGKVVSRLINPVGNIAHSLTNHVMNRIKNQPLPES